MKQTCRYPISKSVSTKSKVRFPFSYFFTIMKIRSFLMTELVTFIDRVESILKAKKLTQKELADKLKLRRPTLSDWKKNGAIPAGDICLKIAQYLDVSVEWLITGKETGYTNEERNIIAQWRELDTSQKDTLKTLLDKWEADRIAEKKHISDA